MVKYPPAMPETQFHPQVEKNPWRRAWQTNIVFWEMPWTEEPGGLQTMGVAKCQIQLRLTLPDPTVLEWLVKPHFSSVQSLSHVRLFATP